MRTIEAVQLAHTESDQFPMAGCCRDCGREWPCDVAVVLAAWDEDSQREIDNAVRLTVERLARAIRTAEVASQMRAESLGAVPADNGPLPDWYRAYAAEVATEYDRLGEP